MHPLVPSQVAKAAGATTAAAAAQDVLQTGTITVTANVYTGVAVLLALVGVILARLVSPDVAVKEGEKRESWRGPWTWIAVLMVCPLIWHFKIAIPWASLIGLGTGYSVRVILRVLGNGAESAARAAVRQAADALNDTPAPSVPMAPEERRHVNRALTRLTRIDNNLGDDI